MHYCYVTYGSWEHNAGHLRPREMGKALIERGVDVTYILDDVPYNRTNLPPQLHPKARAIYVPRHRGQTAGRRRALAELTPDYLHLINPHAKSYLAVAGNKKLKVVGEWDEPPIWRGFGIARHALEVMLDRWLRGRADRIIVCTKYLQDYFRDVHGIDAPYIPHATYLPSYPEGESPFAEPTAVYMGNLFPNWDHDVIFHAAKLLADRGKRPRITFLGTGPDVDHWKKFVSDSGLSNVTLAGFVTGEALWRHLRHARVLLFPIRDTLLNKARCPSKIFAYAQARRPVIANRVGEVPQVLGEGATYVECMPESFASAIDAVMSEESAPDVEYHAERHNYADRVERLLKVLEGPRPLARGSRSAMVGT